MRRPLVGICIFFIFGILAARFIQISLLAITIFAAILFILSLIFLKLSFKSSFLILFSFFLLGISIFKNSEIYPPNHIQKYIGYKGRYIALRGMVDSDPIIKDSNYGRKTTFVLDLKETKFYNRWRKTSGKVLINSFKEQKISYGYELILEGKIYKAPKFAISEKFDYREYLRRRQVFGIVSIKKDSGVEIVSQNSGNPIKAFSFKIKHKIKKKINNHLPSIEAGLLQAMLLGDRSNIPQFIREIFVQTGTIHILAISGLHIGIIAFIVLIFLKAIRIPRKARYIIAMLFLILYVFITGSRVSVVRATIMFLILIGGYLFEKEINILNSLALSCFLILGFNPNQLFDLGFQLSFISVAGIVILGSRIEAFALKVFPSKNKILIFVLRSLSISLAVWLSVLGIIAYNFNIITPITIFANLFIIPFMLIVVALGLCFVVMSLVLQPLGFIFAGSSALSLFILVKITYLLSRIPGAYFNLPSLPLYLVFIYYLLLLVLFKLPPIIERLTKSIKYGNLKLNPMRKIYIISLLIVLIFCSQGYAYWIWTPETKKWTNPKYASKESPKQQFDFAMEFYNHGDYKKAQSEFQKVIHYFPKAFEAAESQYYLGMCLEKLDEPYVAFKAYQKVIDKYPFSERITEITEKQFKIGEIILEQKTSVWQYISGHEYPVIEVFRAVINNAPYSDYAPASYYKIGLFLKEMKSFSEAKDEFGKIMSEYPQSKWVDKAKYQIALCEYQESLRPDYDQSYTKDATEKLEEFVKDNPNTELSYAAKDKIDQLREREAESNFGIGKFYEKQEKIESAKIYYRYVINDYPDSVWAAKSLERLQVIDIK